MIRKITLLAFTLGMLGVAQEMENGTKGTQTDAVGMEDQRPATKPQIFTVEGVHCAGCVAGIQKSVCDRADYISCFVALVDPKAELGEIRITPHPGQIVDRQKVRDQVKSAGYSLSE